MPVSRRLLRRVYGDRAYIEGWALYGQQLMVELGYKDYDRGMKSVMLEQMMRVTTNAILDIKLHAMNMPEAGALNFLLDRHRGRAKDAQSALLRLKLSPATLPAYYVGWRRWTECRNQMKRLEGSAFSLRSFHDRALRLGAIPISLMNELLHSTVPSR
ncbi:MAG: hypothetical protein AMXMBFR57_20220 [Acidimicrobiia bacterium]